MTVTNNESAAPSAADTLNALAPIPLHTADFRGVGDLLTEAVRIGGELPHVQDVVLTDPRDGTEAFAFLSAGGVKSVDPAIFDAYRTKPLQRVGVATHTRLDSFIAHTLRFKADHSAIFAYDDQQSPSLTTIFDYHPEGPDNTTALNRRHAAKYAFPLSEQWKTWTKFDGEKMAMADFAAFLEDNIVDVVADVQPQSDIAKDYVNKVGGSIASPSKLIEISRGLQVNETSQFREARNLTSSESEILFTSQHVDASGAKLVLPNLFMISIPVFARSDDFWQVFARFRYRKVGDSVIFWYELWRTDLVFETAFTEACNQVAAATELPLFFGRAEA